MTPLASLSNGRKAWFDEPSLGTMTALDAFDAARTEKSSMHQLGVAFCWSASKKTKFLSIKTVLVVLQCFGIGFRDY